MEKKPLDSFVFKMAWHEAIQEMPQYDQGDMYQLICEYAKTGKIPENLKGEKRMMLLLIRGDIDFMREPLSPEEHA